MTTEMPDSIIPANLPRGYPAYLGYTDGFWPTLTELEKLFPHAHLVSLTVQGGHAVGCDVESGDLTPDEGVQWADDALRAGQLRPVIYASASVMKDSIIPGLETAKISLASVRLLSAHYGKGQHICGPNVPGCGYPTVDGTQWTSTYSGVNGAPIDMSMLKDDFFGTPGKWVFGQVRAFKTVSVGPSSVKLTWNSPGMPEPLAVADYQVTIRRAGKDLGSYPRSEVKGGNPEEFQFGSLPPGTELEALVRAQAAGGTHSSPWAAVSFTTPVR